MGKFNQSVQLFAEDQEGCHKRYLASELNLQAESFDINLLFSNFQNNQNNLIDFDNIVVGQSERRAFSIKNNGMYSVKF